MPVNFRPGQDPSLVTRKREREQSPATDSPDAKRVSAGSDDQYQQWSAQAPDRSIGEQSSPQSLASPLQRTPSLDAATVPQIPDALDALDALDVLDAFGGVYNPSSGSAKNALAFLDYITNLEFAHAAVPKGREIDETSVVIGQKVNPNGPKTNSFVEVNGMPLFELTPTFGRGSFGKVSHARDLQTSQWLVAKKFRMYPKLDGWVATDSTPLPQQNAPAVAKVATQQSDFGATLRELSYLNKFTSCKVHGVYDTGKFLIAIMDPMVADLWTIAGALRDHPDAEQIILKVLGDVVATLEKSHAAGVIHRDIKPSNIMIAHDGSLVLMDWGMAAPYGHIAPGSGTPSFIPPEGDVGPATVASDIYALGWSMVELVCGTRPGDFNEASDEAYEQYMAPLRELENDEVVDLLLDMIEDQIEGRITLGDVRKFLNTNLVAQDQNQELLDLVGQTSTSE